MSKPNFDTHIPSLDGIRAIAVTIVFVSHAGLGDIIPGGFGVTIFFFLSGYLITTLLRREYETTESINIRNFYLRRIYRILPPMYSALFAAILIQLLTDSPIYPLAVLAQALHVTNYYELFGNSAHVLPGTEVLWSLAVEEHYYLIFPFLIGIMFRRFAYQKIAVTMLCFCAVVLAWRLILILKIGVHDSYTYVATDARLDSIVFGAILALTCNPASGYPTRMSQKQSTYLMLCGVGLIMFTLLYRNQEFRSTFRYSLQGIGLLPIFYCAIRYHDAKAFSWLESRPIRWLGVVSYTFYLIHLIVIDRLKTIIESKLLVAVIAFLLSVAISTLFYFAVERRMGLLRRRLHAEIPNARAVSAVIH